VYPPKLTLEEREEKPPIWDMSQERAFTENLLNQRFQFFLFIFAAVIAGSVNARADDSALRAVLGLGTVICWLFAVLLFHSQRKLDIILNVFLFRDPGHPANCVNEVCKEPRFRPRWLNWLDWLLIRSSKRKFVGYVIPSVCCAALTLGFFLAVSGTLAEKAKR
jgi:hypothetical protein